jgi:acid phosphatase
LGGPPKFERDGCLTPDGHGVNTMAPPFGDRLSSSNVSWAWYAGAWQAALDHEGAGPIPNFQPHHQPFNYFRKFALGIAARERHLKGAGHGDTAATNRFIADIEAGNLPAVSFYKPQGNPNMHAGYADIESGDRHIAQVIEHLERCPQWAQMMVVVTFDENGGWWDHVAPPQVRQMGTGHARPGHRHLAACQARPCRSHAVRHQCHPAPDFPHPCARTPAWRPVAR